MSPYFTMCRLSMFPVMLFWVCGCGGVRPAVTAVSPEDTPARAYDLGDRALGKGDATEALRNFTHAVDLDPEYQYGYIGLALAYSAAGDQEKALGKIRQALRLNTYNPGCYVAYARVYLAQGDYSKAISKLDQALQKNGQYAPAYYWKGRVSELKKEPGSAAKFYRKALEADRQFLPAGEAWQRLQDSERARAGLPPEYLAIAASSAVTRGEMAAILVEELGFDRFLEYRQPVKPQVSTGPFVSPYDPVRVEDMAGSWAAKYIEKTMRYGVMQTYPDQKFRPESPVSRAEFALLLQDVLVKAGKGDISATMFLDSASPFSDVPGNHFTFNAAMLAVSRGFLSGKTSAIFEPAGGVAGAEAIEALKKVRSILLKTAD